MIIKPQHSFPYTNVTIWRQASLAAAMLLVSNSEAVALERCAKEDGGSRQLVLKVKGVTPSDVTNRASGAWNKIGAAAQQQYGNNVNTGMITMTIYVEISFMGLSKWAALPSQFPTDYSGRGSIHQTIANIGGDGDPSAPDPAPCDPDKNACCDECANGNYAFLNPMDIFSKGHVSHVEHLFMQTPRRTSTMVRRRYLA